MIFLAFALLIICLVTSTAETRAAGRLMVKPWGRALGVVTALIWAVILIPWTG